MRTAPTVVILGLDPAIQLDRQPLQDGKHLAWMAGSSPAMTT
jgi:hypothetical protein